MKKLFLLLFLPLFLNASEYKNPFCNTIITLNVELIKNELKKIESDFNKVKEEKVKIEKDIEEIEGYILRWGEEEEKVKKLNQLKNDLKNINSENLAIKPCNNDNLTPLHLVCRWGGHFESKTLKEDLTEIINRMINLGADTKTKTKALKETPIDEVINCRRNCDTLKEVMSEYYNF